MALSLTKLQPSTKSTTGETPCMCFRAPIQPMGRIIAVLGGFVLRKSDIMAGGGAKSNVSGTIDKAFYDLGWREHEFKTTFRVDGNERSSRTHKIDCLRGLVGLEIEWNSKGPDLRP